jgi:transcription elongation GreA/GreB family factor
MNKLELRRQIIDTCNKSLEQSAQIVRATIDEIIKTASDYEGDHDMFDPFKDDMMKKKEVQIQQLEKYLDDIKLMSKVDPQKIHDKVEFGSIVITDKQKMFVAVPLGKIIIDKESYFAISTQVPVYKAMQDLKVGDTFSINNNQFTIKEII